MRARRTAATALAALATTLLVGGLGAAPAAAIAHGTPAPVGSYRFAAKLTMPKIPRGNGTYYSSACSGALISPTWIITAGHCFHDVQRRRVSGAPPYATRVNLDTVAILTSAGVVRTVTSVKQSAVNDIALAKLSAPVRTVTPLALSKVGPPVGQLLTVAGWGATSGVNPAPSLRMFTGVVKVTSGTAATILVTGYAPHADTSACPYDSGAPYVSTPAGAAPRLVSVESTGPTCPHSSPEATSRVDTVRTWIRSVVPDLPAS
jgi:secreted trypsin-like serine protease